ncbi:hypothetical protein H4R24_005477 [Coemansia sp. RSA 988]|nr:hypothetical protein H4R24_005477 [Coemansia sp. RSA 988]
MATLWTVGTNVFAQPSTDENRSSGHGPRKLPENLPKLELDGDSYDFALEMARSLQAHCYDLDEWGAKAVLLSVNRHYAHTMLHMLQRDPKPNWKEVVKVLLQYVPARLGAAEAAERLGDVRMDINQPLLCYLQKFEKLRVLSGVRKSEPKVHSHFIAGVTQVQCS